MKSAQQYLDEAVAAKPSPYDYGDFEEAQALAAVQAALNDAAAEAASRERYKDFLAMALVNNNAPNT